MCHYLASLICVRCSCFSGARKESAEVDAVEPDSPNPAILNAARHRRLTESPYSSSPEAKRSAIRVVGDTERLLVDIRDLLRTAVRNMTRHRLDKEANERMVNDWMVAAAVIDRLCFIFIAVSFIGGIIALSVPIIHRRTIV